ncbi:MAG: hypothetical protein JWO73_439 [Candidatus Taylorbacteria bacterium]|nr:hypothetical protein [Candidatus Taylorbacteria bacterium]
MDPIAPRPLRNFLVLAADSFSLVKRNVHSLALISVIPLVFIGAATAAFSSAEHGGDFGLASVVSIIGVFCILGTMFFKVLFPLVIIRAIGAADAEPSASADLNAVDLYRKSFADFWPYLLVAVLLCFLILFGLFVAVIPGIIAALYFGFALFAYAFEGKRGVDALISSAWLVRGRLLPVFQRLISGALLAGIAMLIAAIVLQLAFFHSGFGDSVVKFVLDLLVAMFIMPFAYAYGYFMYRDLSAGAGSQIDPAFAKKAKKWLTALAAIGAVLLAVFPILLGILMVSGKLLITS